MPIFQDDEHDLNPGQGVEPDTLAKCPRTSPPLKQTEIVRRLSEESIRTELCEGPLPDTPEDQATRPTGTLNTGFEFPLHGHGTFDRGELIDRLKKGESPTWLPNRNLETLLQDDNCTPKTPAPDVTINSSPLLPSPQFLEPQRTPAVDVEQLQAGLQIERPRSALHSGDFTEGPQESIPRDHDDDYGLFGSQKSTWLATSPPRNFSPFQVDPRFPSVDRLDAEFESRSRIPSLSSSYSSGFVLKPPTSPLVQSESNDDLDLSSNINPIDIDPHQKRNSRRHTLNAPHSVHSTPNGSMTSSFRPLPHLRRDNTHPYQAHQPRRSLTSNPLAPPSSSPQSPSLLRSRRPSYQIDNSPLNHASMVGSYEESILRGRMSTTPSKPLDFMAQIGVLGLGKCKTALRCPAHVMLPFPAVFYSYETTTHGRSAKSEDGPSPYVGQIDLENSLPNPDEARNNKRKQRNVNIGRTRIDNLDAADSPNTSQPSDREIRRVEKQKRRSTSPRAPPGGSYRIPEKGQLQVIIKNPNKTAVKLFLVPYDLTGMEPGTKTFIRQRSYSTGPIIDSALSSSQQPPAIDSVERPTLRYLIHLHICSPSRGRFYLYKSIRVVFANRVPDGKEKLRNEISMPDPRYSVYKPVRDSGLAHSIMSGTGANLAAENAFRRRSSGFALGPSNRTYDGMEGIAQALEKGLNNGSAFSHSQGASSALPIEPIPFSLSRKPTRNLDDSGQEQPSNIQSPDSNKSSISPSSNGMGNSMSWDSNSTGIGGYGKLNKGDVGYGGNPFVGSPDGRQAVAEGLLAKKLRDLGVGRMGVQEGMDGN